MLPILVILCLASSQVLGAAVLHDVHGDSSASKDHVVKSSHSDGEYHEASSSSDSEYAYSKGSGSGVSDGQVAGAYNHGAYGFPAHYIAPVAHHGAYVNGHNEYEYSYDKGTGSKHMESSSKDHIYNNDDASDSTSYAAENNHDYNSEYKPGYFAAPYPNTHAAYKRSAYYAYPSYNGYYGYYGNHYAAYPYVHAAHKRSASYNYPSYARYGYGYRYGYPAAHYNHY